MRIDCVAAISTQLTVTRRAHALCAMHGAAEATPASSGARTGVDSMMSETDRATAAISGAAWTNVDGTMSEAEPQIKEYVHTGPNGGLWRVVHSHTSIAWLPINEISLCHCQREFEKL